MRKIVLPLLCLSLVLSSCVSKKDFAALQKANEDAERNLQKDLEVKDKELQSEQKKVEDLQDQLEYLKRTNTNLLDRLADLSIVSKEGAESIKQSLEAINEQSKYIKDLTSSIQVKDSLNLALVMNLKRSLGSVKDEDVNVEVKKGVVYISISDKMLFRSGSAVINQQAEEVLGKIAKVVNDHENLDILVEGHTDNVPISTDCVRDNWDLSVKRATSVVRVLQDKYKVDPSRMTAGGRSEYVPKDDNTTAQGRSTNRRTEIIILPKLDEFFQLMNPQN